MGRTCHPKAKRNSLKKPQEAPELSKSHCQNKNHEHGEIQLQEWYISHRPTELAVVEHMHGGFGERRGASLPPEVHSVSPTCVHFLPLFRVRAYPEGP